MMRKIRLQGKWGICMNQGKNLPEKKAFVDFIDLPSTTECAKKGIFAPDNTETLHLSRRYPIEGMVWYERQIEIPKAWENKEIILNIERTKFTAVYVDGSLFSSSFETIIPQKHKLGRMGAGLHTLTVGVDNALTSYGDFPPGLMDGHQYTDHTQTNWNGLLGDISLEAKESVYFTGVSLVKEKGINKICARLHLFSSTAAEGSIKLELRGDTDGRMCFSREIPCMLQEGENQAEYFIEPEEKIQCWDEFTPFLYEAGIKWCGKDGKEIDSCCMKTGFPEIEIKNKLICNHGVPVYLRGTVDCCIYPLTGAAPMDEKEWMTILKKMKEYGLNHYRFHSWCPPEAAFKAADMLGMYLEVEMSGFALGLYERNNEKYDSVLERYYYDQAEKILKTFGNHPSFLIFAVGNELVGDVASYDRLIRSIRPLRPDKLYTQGANNFLEEPVQGQEDDLWIMMRTSKTHNIRGSFAHSDKPLGHIQSQEPASARVNYKEALTLSSVPLIAHEIGQYQIYPDYTEIRKYTGVLEPSALKIYRKRLEDKAQSGLAPDYARASGKLTVQCYKEEIEAQLRTEGMSGFQLLGLQDFPGQGTALVGILDSFLDSKGLISPGQWRQFCAPCVVLACFDSYVWQSRDRMSLEVLCPNFSAGYIEGAVKVSFKDNNTIISDSDLGTMMAGRGQWNRFPITELMLPEVKEAKEIIMELSFAGLRNCYSIFIYPRELLEAGENVFITNKLDESAETALKEGRNVLLLNRHTEGEIPGFFPADFWCYPMFRDACLSKGMEPAPGTMGLLISNTHPALSGFPTKDWAQWQWQQIVVHGHSDVLDEDSGAELIVEVIDNFQRSHRLGLIYEKQVGKGKLLFCNVDLQSHLHRPEIRCLYNSLLRYLKKR
ncbi:MAG: glycoside hydrolase family 2 TIM barrel-domain containing protein [Eubacteriales bacterium]|nr:glycoside hydrolase family 2 TIM barrel-domain containing protein [Eubacteriales bacterium]